MQGTNTYETLIINDKARAEFFSFYDGLIADLKKHGFAEAAVIHAKNRKRIRDELALLD